MYIAIFSSFLRAVYPVGVTNLRPYFTQIIGHNSVNVHRIPTKLGTEIRLNESLTCAKLQPDWSTHSCFMANFAKCAKRNPRRSYISIWTLYSIYHKRTAINFSTYFHFNTLATRSHALTLNLASSTINAFRHSFFVTTPFLWNSIPFEILSQRTAGSFKTRLKHYLFL